MNRTKYNIGELFGLAFGRSPITVSKTILTRLATGGDLLNRYKVDTDGQDSPEFSFEGISVQEVDPDIEIGRQSYLGTDIIYPIILKGGVYNRYNAQGEVESVSIDDFELPAITTSTFRRAKNISQTRRLAGSGTVKEMYGFDDWQIDIKGLCLRDPSHPSATTAWQQHLALLEFDNLADSVGVVGSIYNSKGIDAIVISEIFFGQIPGKPGVIAYQIRAVSDTPKELEL